MVLHWIANCQAKSLSWDHFSGAVYYCLYCLLSCVFMDRLASGDHSFPHCSKINTGALHILYLLSLPLSQCHLLSTYFCVFVKCLIRAVELFCLQKRKQKKKRKRRERSPLSGDSFSLLIFVRLSCRYRCVVELSLSVTSLINCSYPDFLSTDWELVNLSKRKKKKLILDQCRLSRLWDTYWHRYTND